MISLGAFTLYFLVYQLVGTNAVTGQAQAALGDELAREWSAPAAPNAGQGPGGRIKEKPAPEGKAFAKIRIPDIHVSQVLVEGTGRDDLRKGPGRISSGKMPGEPGTFAVSGHRTTYGAPFHDVDDLGRGDRIELTMPYGRFTYRVERTRIVAPTAIEVTDPVGYDRLVLSACHPLYSAAQRIIVFARLERAEARGPAAE
jgi:sortase A